MNGRRLRLGLLAWCTLCATRAVAAPAADASAVALHERIDRLIDSSHVGPPVALVGDAEFLRRISLDLTGMPPSPEELRCFLADPGADKRARAVDRLLESPLYARHLATTLDVMLMERRPSQNVTAGEWQTYLLKATRENRPLDQLLKEVLSADGADANLRPAARFYLDRGLEPNLITRDVGRIVFGCDLQCAQCHNHPLIEDYRQSDYQGLLAFFAPAYAFSPKKGGKATTYYAEKAGGDIAYDSVFVKDDKHRTGPRIFGGTELSEPVFPPGEEYQVKHADNVLPVPKFSRRVQLATLATDGTNRAFNENLANRLWAVMMGRGLVQPLDMHHPANPPSHPEVLKLLADEIVALNYDARAFLRELALSRTYQRAMDLPVDQTADSEAITSTLAELKTQTALLTATSEAAENSYSAAIKAWHAAESTFIPAATEQDQALAKHSEAVKKQAEAQKAVDQIDTQIAARQDVAKTLAEAAGKAQEAVKKLPAEKDLAVAAQKFADRSSAMIAELAALQKTSAEKSAALKKAAGDVAVAVTSVEMARARALPLREAVRQKEEVVLAAREKAAEGRMALEHHKMRLDLLKTYLERRDLEAQAAAAAGAGAQNAVADEESRVKALQSEVAAATEQLSTLMCNDFDLAQLKPLTPEELCWSMLKVTGVYDRSRQAEEAALNKSKPLTDEVGNAPAQMRARALEVEERTFDKLKGNLPAFVTVYAAAAGQPQNDFFATADQALFAANDGLVNGWVAPAGGNISDRMVLEQDPRKAAEDLFVTILTRFPSAEESADVVRILTEGAANKSAAVQELVWGLLTSAEFRFNH